MIKNIFIPEQINGYFVMSKRTIGINIHKSYVQATRLLLHQRSLTVEKNHTQPLENNTDRSYQERLEIALKATIDAMGTYDELRTSLSSSEVIFKELTLPFTDQEKISNIIHFEIEQFLPFSLSEAVIDFIITDTDVQTNQTTVMVAATRKETIAKHIALFQALNISPDVITVDMFDLYGFYEQFIEKKDQQEATIIINGTYEQTHIALIKNGKLLSIRSLQNGINSLIKQIVTETKIEPKKALEDLFRFGVEKHDDTAYSAATKKALQHYWSAISFTIDAWIAQHFPGKSINSLLLVGPLVEIIGIPDYLQQLSSINCSILNTHNLKQTVPIEYIQSLATALPSAITRSFNLKKGEFASSRITLVNQQLFTGIVLGVAFLTLLFVHGSLYINKLNKVIKNSEYQTIEYLEESGLAIDADSLEEAVEESESKVAQEESIWFSFSSETRFSFLKNLEQLSSAIDREGIGLNLKKLSMTSSSITLDGTVRDFQALKTLERELKKSNLFVSVPTLQETSFSNLKLLLKKQNGGKS